MMHPWIEQHRRFLEEIGEWYCRVRRAQGSRMQCGRGCALCCHGLFDVSLADAFLVAEAVQALPPALREEVTDRARRIQSGIAEAVPQLPAPYFLHTIDEQTVDEIVESANASPCVFLGTGNECLIYNNRPLACRLEGLPMVDSNDGLFGDWCELNFADGVPAEVQPDLKRDYYELQNIEEIATEVVSEAVLGERQRQLTVFIPSIAAAFESFWRKLL